MWGIDRIFECTQDLPIAYSWFSHLKVLCVRSCCCLQHTVHSLRHIMSFLSSLSRRGAGSIGPASFKDGWLGDCSLVGRIGKHSVLDGHQGCVNTVSFNETGDR